MVRIGLMLARVAPVLLSLACGNSPSTPAAPAAAPPPTSSFTVTFGENPVPFRTSGCSNATPPGWYTTARLQETAGVAFTPSGLIQKLDGTVSAQLAESFNSRFGACAGSAFTPGTLAANGAVCASVGICTQNTVSTYQFQITGTDANGHAVTFDSPVLQLSAR